MPDGAAVVVAAPGAAVVVVPSGWADGFDGADGSDGLDGSEGLAGAAVVVVPSAAVISQKKIVLKTNTQLGRQFQDSTVHTVCIVARTMFMYL